MPSLFQGVLVGNRDAYGLKNGSATALKAITNSFLSTASTGSIITSLVNPFSGTTTYTAIGTVPSQFTFDSTTGNILKGSGSATVGSNYSIKVRATSQDGTREVAETLTFRAVLDPNIPIPPLTVNGTLTNAIVGSSSVFTPTISGGVAPYNLSLASGAFPPGRDINGLSVTGTYQTAGTYTYTLMVTDSLGTVATLVVGPLVVASSSALPAIAPNPAWTGTAGSGYAGSPPTVVASKATIRQLTPDGGFIGGDDSSPTFIGVHAWASKADGSGGAATGTMRCYIEGNSYIVPMTYQVWNSAFDGTSVGAWGYWAKLDSATWTVNGIANVYWEFTPDDAPGEKSCIGPFFYGRQAVKRPVTTYVTPSRTAADSHPNYNTVTAALAYLRSNSIVNGEVVLTESGIYTIAVQAPGSPVENFPYAGMDKGRTLIRPASNSVVATFAHPNLSTGGSIRPRFTGITFRGVRIDIANYGTVSSEPASTYHAPWFDGCEFFSSTGRFTLNALNYTENFGSQCFFTECYMHDTLWGFVSSTGIQLIRNCKLYNIAGDATITAPNIYGLQVANLESGPYRVYRDAATIQYTGSGTGTLARTGSNGASTGTLVAVINGTTTTINLSFSKTVQSVLDELTAAGVTVTVGTEAAMWPSNYLQIGNTLGAQSAIDIKTATKQLTTFVDIHGDIVQNAPNNTIYTNILAYNAPNAQSIFLTDKTYNNVFIINYSVTSGTSALIGQFTNPHNNVNVWHATILDQPVALRVTPPAGKTAYNPDNRCSIVGSVFNDLYFVGTPDTDVRIVDNHIILTSGPTQGVNTTTGGSKESLFVSAATGDMSLAKDSALRTSTVNRIVPFDLYNNPRDALTFRGASAKAATMVPYALLSDFETLGSATVGSGTIGLHTGSRKVLNTSGLQVIGASSSTQQIVANLGTISNPDLSGVDYVVMAIDVGTPLENQVTVARPQLTSGGNTYSYYVDTANNVAQTDSLDSQSMGRRWKGFKVDNFRVLNFSGASIKTTGAAAKTLGVRVESIGGNGAGDVVVDAFVIPSQSYKPTIMLTVDDANTNQYFGLFPATQSRAVPVTAYPPMDMIGTPIKLTMGQCREMWKAGWAMCPDSASLDEPLTGFNTLAAAMAALNSNRDKILASGMIGGAEHLCYSFGRFGYLEAPITVACTANGTTTLTLATSVAFQSAAVGVRLTGTNVPANTFITGIVSASVVTTNNAIPSGVTSVRLLARKLGQTVTCNGTTTVTLSDTSDLFVGMHMLCGTIVPTDTRIVSIDSSTQITVSNAVPSNCQRASFGYVDGEFWHTKVLNALIANGYKSARRVGGNTPSGIYTGFGVDPYAALTMRGTSWDNTTQTTNLINNMNNTIAEGNDMMAYMHVPGSTYDSALSTHVNTMLDAMVALRDAGKADILTVPQWWAKASSRLAIS